MDAIRTDERTAIKAGIDAWITAVEGRDNAQLPQVVTQDASSVWIGPNAAEWLPGYAALEQAMQAQNAALEDIRIEVSEETIHVSPQADMAWATNQWIFNARMGDQSFAAPLRCTWILEKQQDRWIIVHFHKSAALPV
jgi:ketosteroid isomerase-like protein